MGDNFIAGTIVGRVRALINDRGDQVKTVGPSSPVEVLGLTGLPQPGDAFQAVDDASKARQIALIRQNQAKQKALADRSSRMTLESLQQQLTEGGTKELPIIIKADVQGSAEVLAQSLEKLGDETRQNPHYPHGCRRDQRIRRASWLRHPMRSSSVSTSAGSQRSRRGGKRGCRYPEALRHLQRDG